MEEHMKDSPTCTKQKKIIYNLVLTPEFYGELR